MLQESYAHAADDMNARALAEAQVDAERIATATAGALQTDGGLLLAPERDAIEHALAEVRRLISGEDRRALQAAVDALNRVTEPFAARRMDRGVARALTGRRVDALN